MQLIIDVVDYQFAESLICLIIYTLDYRFCQYQCSLLQYLVEYQLIRLLILSILMQLIIPQSFFIISWPLPD